MKLYVAGKFDNRDYIHTRIEYLQSLGYEITHDWTQVETSNSLTNTDLAKYASQDVNGVLQADLLLILITDEDYPYRGTTTELGVALGQNKPVVVIDPFENSIFNQNIFVRHGLVTKYSSLKCFLATENKN